MKTQSLNTIGPKGSAKRGTFGDYAQRFHAYLKDQGYAPATLRESRCRINALGARVRERRIALAKLDEAMAIRLLAKVRLPESHRKFAERIVRLFVRFLVEQGVGAPPVPPTPAEEARIALRQEYEAYLRHQRGLSEETIYNCWRLAERFLVFRFGDKTADFAKLRQADIVGFLQHVHAQPRPNRTKTTSSHLRSLFQYLFRIGKTKTNLALGIPSVSHRYEPRLRRHLTAEQVERVLAAVRSDTPIGRRNYAMVLLLARLGLRAPEVIAMQLDDIDWRAGEILVRGKGQQHDRVPLPQDVGGALADYIRRDRVTTSRTLFVTDHGPHVRFKGGQILNAVLKEALAKAGVKPPAPYVGSHVLRHSLAVNLVQRGASLDEIANILRHRSRASTMVYAKLDIEGLRSIAQPWPIKGGAK